MPRRLRRAVGGDDVGTMADAADDRRPFSRLTARENAERQIGKMQAGPEHGAVVPADAGRSSCRSLPVAAKDDIEIGAWGLLSTRGSGRGTRLTSSARASARFQMRACGAPTG